MVGSSLEVIMDKFNTLASQNCCNFISSSKHIVCNGMNTMDSIMVLKDHSEFKYIHDSKFPKQSRHNVCL